MPGKVTKYTTEVLKYVQDNLKQYGFEKVAEAIGVKKSALLKQITKWRADGIEIPNLRLVKEGEVREQKQGDGILYKRQKVGKGWVTIERVTPYVEEHKRNSFSFGSEQKVKSERPKKKHLTDKDPQLLKLKGSDPIYIAEHDREVAHWVRIDGKTWALKHKKVA